MFDDELAASDLDDLDAGDADLPSGWWDVAEVARVGCLNGPAGGDEVVDAEDVVDGDV